MIRNRINGRLCATIIAAVSIGGFAEAAETGVTKDKLIIGAYLPLQGGLAAGANQMRDGADAYFRFVNEAGGIHGRKIEWRVENDSYNPQQTFAVTRKLVDRDGVFAIVSTLGTATNLAVLPFLKQRNVPLINPAGGSPLLLEPKDRNVFGLFPVGEKQGKSLVEYALPNFKSRRFAIFFQNDQFGKDQRDGAVAALKAHSLEPVAEASYVPTDVDVSAQAIALRNANPDAVLMYSIPRHGALLLREAEKLGWTPKFLGTNTMGDPITHKLAGSALNGVVISIITAVDTMPHPKVQEANRILQKYHPNTAPGYWSYLGMAGAMVFVEGLKRAGPDLTREKLIEALETLQGFETGVVPPISFGKGNHAGNDKFGYAVWQDGKLKVVQGW